jgi:DDE superfamily endonuclease
MWFFLFKGHLLAKGNHTIADILRAIDFKDIKNFSKFHWVLSGAKWSAFKGAKILLIAIINTFSLEEVIIPLDTHVERRKGEKIRGLGRQRDAVQSTKNRKVLTIGLLWLVASVSVKLPFCPIRWALPFFSQLIPPKRPLSSSRNKRDLRSVESKHKTLTEWVVQLIAVIRKWLTQTIKFVIVADVAFACHKIAHACAKANGALISRLRMDARMFYFPDGYKKKKRKTPSCREKMSLIHRLSQRSKLNLAGNRSRLVWRRKKKNIYLYWDRALVCIWDSSSAYSMGVG